ncbi:hypothetical protein N9B82_05860, partial [Saprospiraceae bacterium]|nr:hypothetical protein [Saprospiraceae bacterium]
MLKQTATLFFILLTSIVWGQTSSSELEGILKANQQKLVLSDQDLSELLITDNYTSLGINHTYFKQAVGGIEVYNSYGAVHGRSGSMFLDGNSLIQQLSSYKV